MLRISRAFVLVVSVAALALAGCGRSSSDAHDQAVMAKAATAAAPSGSTSTPVAGMPIKAVVSSLPGDHESTSRYRIDIDYPSLPDHPALVKTLRDTGDKAKHEFMHSLPDPKERPEIANRQLQLKITFSVASRMPRFISVREQGMANTGGAHPIPVDASFVYDTQVGKVITLDDLFVDPAAARSRLAGMARKSLQEKLLKQVPGGTQTSAQVRKEWIDNMRKMITEGTEPTAENFSEFGVLAGADDAASGLELIFSPYQVAPYVYGTQTVDIPVDAFADQLKPSYRNAFDTRGAGH